MGEYAKYANEEIKIGTCESMYYLRYDDRMKVQKVPNSLDPATCKNLFWRLPFPDEDNIGPGGYDDYNRGLRLYRTVKAPGDQHSHCEDFSDASAVEDVGIIQLRHEASGLLLNVPCYHGVKLPDVTAPMRAFWNGKGHSFELAHIKNTDQGLKPVVRCRHCGEMWRYTWDEVLPFVADPEMHARLSFYALTCEQIAA